MAWDGRAEEKKRRADLIVVNDGGSDALEAAVDGLWSTLVTSPALPGHPPRAAQVDRQELVGRDRTVERMSRPPPLGVVERRLCVAADARDRITRRRLAPLVAGERLVRLG